MSAELLESPKDEIIPLEANRIAYSAGCCKVSDTQDLKNSEGIEDFPWGNVTKEI